MKGISLLRSDFQSAQGMIDDIVSLRIVAFALVFRTVRLILTSPAWRIEEAPSVNDREVRSLLSRPVCCIALAASTLASFAGSINNDMAAYGIGGGGDNSSKFRVLHSEELNRSHIFGVGFGGVCFDGCDSDWFIVVILSIWIM